MGTEPKFIAINYMGINFTDIAKPTLTLFLSAQMTPFKIFRFIVILFVIFTLK